MTFNEEMRSEVQLRDLGHVAPRSRDGTSDGIVAQSAEKRSKSKKRGGLMERGERGERERTTPACC